MALLGLLAMKMLDSTGSVQTGITYDTAVAAKGSIRKLVSTSGPVRALVTVSIGSQVSGQVDKLSVDFNSEVKSGDVLATIDARSFDAKVSQAKADLTAARAGVLNQEATLTKAKAVLSLAERSSQRQETLQAKGYAATATLDTARRDVEVAKADVEVANAQIESAKA